MSQVDILDRDPEFKLPQDELKLNEIIAAIGVAFLRFATTNSPSNFSN